MTNEKLAVLIQNGETDRMAELWSQVERLVAWKAHRVAAALPPGTNPEIEDFISAGYLAMVEAVTTYQAEKGSFHSWLMFHVKNAFAVEAGYRTVTQKHDPGRYALSLSMPLSEEEGGELSDIVPDPEGEKLIHGIEDRIYHDQLKTALDDALKDFPQLPAEILRRRYYHDQTLKEVADEMGLSPGMVHTHEFRAMQRIRSSRHGEKLRSFADYNYFSGTGLSSFRQSWTSPQEKYLIHQEMQENRRCKHGKLPEQT